MHKLLKFSLLIIVFCGSFIEIAAQTQTAADYFETGLRLAREQKFEAALAAFRQSVKIEPAQAAAHGNIGMTLLALRRETESVASFREAVRLAPADTSFRIGLCQSLSVTKNHAEAVAQCEEAVKINADSVAAHAALVAALLQAKRGDDAVRRANAALQKFAEDETILNFAAEANQAAGNYQRAVEFDETLVRIRPNSVLPKVRLAENYLKLERDAEAIAVANQAIALDKHPRAYFFLGRVYFELGQNEEAANAFRQSTALDAGFADGFYFLGLSESRRGKTIEAANALRQAIALAPDKFEYYKELGSVLTDDAKYAEAVAPLKKAVALNPKNFEATVGLGLALFESARFEEGITILAEAERMKPGNSIVNMFQGVARSRQQGLTQIEDMKRFAKENPKDLNVRLGLLQFLGYAGRLPEAEIYIQEVLAMNPKDVRVHGLIGAVYMTANKFDEAAEIYRKSLTVEQNPTAYLGLASYHTKRGQIAEAERAYLKVFELQPNSPNIMLRYASLLRDNGKRREALDAYNRSLAILPTNAPALFGAGVLAAKLGDLNQARQHLETLKLVDAQSAKQLARFLRIYR